MKREYRKLPLCALALWLWLLPCFAPASARLGARGAASAKARSGEPEEAPQGAHNDASALSFRAVASIPETRMGRLREIALLRAAVARLPSPVPRVPWLTCEEGVHGRAFRRLRVIPLGSHAPPRAQSADASGGVAHGEYMRMRVMRDV